MVFGGLTILLHPYYELSSSILSNIFTGFIVSTVVALIGYFHEKQKIINNIYDNIDSLYINLVAIKDITGKIVPQVATANDLTKLEYCIIESLTSLNIEFMKKMELKFYNGFFSNSKLSKVIKEFINYKNELYNLKQLAFELYSSTLKYELQVKNIKLQEIEASTDEILGQYKNTINIKTAKLHEYEASLIIQLDKLAEEFYKCNKPKLNWNELKADLQQQADLVTKRYNR